jgi:hypothetical protein
MQAVWEGPEAKSDSYKALRLILEAWDEGAEQGIAPELMAYAALFTALTDLVSAFGEDAVAQLASGLDARVRQGEFTMCGTRQ